MARYLRSGIQASQSTPASGTIHRLTDEVTAFVGRTLRGPLSRPVSVHSFDEFSAHFGGLWNSSPLSFAVLHFFQNGGATAVIVRVARDAVSPTLELPADSGPLIVRAAHPGRHESIRAAVDYDGIDDTSCFNLTVQRLRSFDSETILAQEIYRGVSVDAAHRQYLGRALERSDIVVLRALAPSRPHETLRREGGRTYLYRDAQLDGDDGDVPSDENLLGGSRLGDGLFALGGDCYFSQLYLPPPDFERDVGAPVLRAAARICARRDALLICDAPRQWRSVMDAEHGIRHFSLRSSNAALYFPRLWMNDPAGQPRLVAPGGAVAGILARISREHGLGAAPAGQGASARGVRGLAVQPGEKDCYRLGKLGVNCMRIGRGGRRVLWDARTLVDESDAAAAWQSLRIRRIALYLKRCVREYLCTRTGDARDAGTRALIAQAVNRFLHEHFVTGLFRGGTPDSAYSVRCDATPDAEESNEVRLEIAFAPLAPGQFLHLKLHAALPRPIRDGEQEAPAR